MGKNLIVAQSGGPSAAINATLAGVIAAAKAAAAGETTASPAAGISRIYGGLHGIEGILEDRLVDLTDFTDFERLKATPAMALGSCRCKLPPAEQRDAASYRKLAGIFQDYDIGYFLYIGGNDSMDTVLKLSQVFSQEGIAFVGLPKTIDNDLPLTDHTPGYGSAARYLAVTMGEIIQDTAIYAAKAVTIVEIMGRNAGWLTLAAGLPRFTGGSKPDIIALPEVPFDEEEFLAAVRSTLERSPNAVIAVSEGIRDKNGQYVGSSAKSGAVDIFGHAYLSGVGKYLEGLVKQEIGCKVRSIELNLMQRCSAHLASLTDIEEAFDLGKAGVERALSGETGRMLTINRISDSPYAVSIQSADIRQVANQERLVPERWHNLDDPAAVRDICAYILPLIKGDVPQFRNAFDLNEYVSFLP